MRAIFSRTQRSVAAEATPIRLRSETAAKQFAARLARRECPMGEAIPASRQVSAAVSRVDAAKTMTAVRFFGMLCVVLATGCTAMQGTPSSVIGQSAPPKVDPAPAAPAQDMAAAQEAPRPDAQASAAPASPPAKPNQPTTTSDAGEPAGSAPGAASRIQSAAEAEVQGAAPTAPQPRPVQGAAKTAPPSAQAPAKAAAPIAVEQAPKNQQRVAVAKTQEAPLDVAALKERLRDTDAIGVFTKLALKNQVDALLQQFRTHYLNGQKTAPAALRQQYDMLVLKVLALLQDGDPPLAKTIAGSREAIWGILADPVKFNAAS